MITTLLLSILNFLWYGLFDLLIPVNVPFLSLSTYQTNLTYITERVGSVYTMINTYIPVGLLISLIMAFVMINIIIFSFQGARFVVSIFKGGIK